MMISEGSTLRDYRILSKLGEGGMGSVYLAEDTMLDRKVALKVLNPVLTTDPQFTERFRHEAKVQASLIHPNIVALHTFFEDTGKFCIVMEFVEGITLKELIKRNGPIPEKRTIKIISQVLDALAYAHSKGIIHRDIKPSNIIIDKGDLIKIMDFGVAKILGGEQSLTKTGGAVGTIWYMSPEQIRAEKDIDQRSDIYSLGITLFEMLTGKIPYDESTNSDFIVMQQIVGNDIPDPRDIYPCISEGLVNIVKKMTNKNKGERFNSCLEIIKKLENPETVVVKEGSEIPSAAKPKSEIKIEAPKPIEERKSINNNKREKKLALSISLCIFTVIAALVIVYFVFFAKSIQQKIEDEIYSANFIEAGNLIDENSNKLGESSADEYRNLIKGLIYLDDQKYLRANSLINNFNIGIIGDKHLAEKIIDSKIILSRKLQSIEQSLNSLVDEYSQSLKSNDINAHINLFADNAYSFGNKLLNKQQLYKTKSKFFSNYFTSEHKMKMKSFGAEDDGLIEVISEEYHFTVNKNNEQKGTGALKRFVIKGDVNNYRIFIENNIKDIMNFTPKYLFYKDYTFRIKTKKAASEGDIDSDELSIKTPSGKVITDTDLYRAELSVDDFDNDGEYEIIVADFSGGAHCCNSYKIYKPTDFDLQKSAILNTGHADLQFIDLDNNGTREFRTFNSSYAYVFTSFAGSIFPPLVYDYRNGIFEESTAKYSDLIREDFNENVQSINRLLSEHNNQLDCSGSSIEFDVENQEEAWMGEYRAYLAAAVTDLLLLEGRVKAREFFEKYYICTNTAQQFWNKINQLVVDYHIPENNN